jgi:leucyl aminopeptidase
MFDIQPETLNLKITQSPGAPQKDALSRLDHVIIILPNKPDRAVWKTLPDGSRLRSLARRLGPDTLLRSRLGNAAGTGLTIGRPAAPDGFSNDGETTFSLLKMAGQLAATALAERPKNLGIMVAGFDPPRAERIVRAAILAIGAHGFSLPEYKSAHSNRSRLKTVKVIGAGTRLDLRRTLAEIEAGNLVRWLTRLPPNKLDARQYRQLVGGMAKANQWKMNFLDIAKLKRLKAGAFLAVAQGNANADAGIIHLQYRPTRARRPILSLVGKGILFDTGGTNLKPFKSMLDMHEDMAGSAVALATLLALTRLDFGYPVDCWLAITENRLSPNAYKSRDVVSACNGTTIEVIHTDAEGRMVLADALALASREKPGMIIDYATLTGTCVSAVTERYSGVFTNTAELNSVMIDAGRESGERVWPFPMDGDFEEDLKSAVADIMQCSPGAGGDHILAARFLQRFVPQDRPWVHVDLSAAARKEGLAQVPSGPTGFGVRFTLNLLLDQGQRLEQLIGDDERRQT